MDKFILGDLCVNKMVEDIIRYVLLPFSLTLCFSITYKPLEFGEWMDKLKLKLRLSLKQCNEYCMLHL